MTPLDVRSVDLRSTEAPVQFVKSLQQTGFAVLHHHPIDMDLVNDVYSLWSDFFNSSQKHDYLFHSINQDGYFPFKSEHAKGSDEEDLKEFFHIYPWSISPVLTAILPGSHRISCQFPSTSCACKPDSVPAQSTVMRLISSWAAARIALGFSDPDMAG